MNVKVNPTFCFLQDHRMLQIRPCASEGPMPTIFQPKEIMLLLKIKILKSYLMETDSTTIFGSLGNI